MYGGLGQILTFHRVIPAEDRPRIHNHQSLEVSPTHLEQVILFFQQRGYQFYSLDQLYDALAAGTLQKKTVVFTFDDGYQDVYTYAYPVFQRYQVPFTIYVSTNFPDQTAILWWYMLETFVQENESIQFALQGRVHAFPTQTLAEKEAAFAAIRTIILQQPDQLNLEETLQAVFGSQYASLRQRTQSMALSWEEIRELARDPLVTIGAHTINHYPLSQLPSGTLETEVAGSKAQLENAIGQPVEHFAYPFGKKTEASLREFEAVKQAGFKTGTTTRIGNVFAQHKALPEALPRISINEVTQDAVLELQVSGLIPFVVNRGKRVVTD